MDTKHSESVESPQLNEDDVMGKTIAILPWDRFYNWIHCACVVTFDLELGQAMEVLKFKETVHCC